jgi:hypothetical protein
MSKPQKIYECIGKGGRYVILYHALPAGTLKDCGAGSLVVYQNNQGMTFVRIREDFEARMREVLDA